jgi:pimeloyl-ACP methyl ester carboxylesterase
MLVIAAAAFTLVGCGSTGSYTSDAKFDSAIVGPIESLNNSYQGPFRHPVIIIHGFLGGKLIDTKTGENVWGKFTGWESISPSAEYFRELALPMQLGKPLNDIKDNVVTGGILDTVKVRILGFTVTEDAYINLIKVLQTGGFQPEGYPLEKGCNYNTLFCFSYDWRRDLQWNAARLHEFILEKRKYIQKQYEVMYGIKNFDVQFDLIGHSMGGLVSRYYLRYGTADLPKAGEQPKITWAGAKYVDRVIILGTPNAGYLDTLLELNNGKVVPPFPPALLGTWATYYQMMPAPSRKSVVYADNPKEAVDIFDINVWMKMKWGLLNPSQDEALKKLLPNVSSVAERKKVALDHLKKCLDRAKRFVNAMAVEATPPDDVQLYLVLGNAVKTTRRAKLDRKTGELTVIDYAPGDGKVTQSSALYDKRAGGVWTPWVRSPIHWRGIIQLRAAHMGITTAPAFKDNILFLLNAMPTKSQLKYESSRK